MTDFEWFLLIVVVIGVPLIVAIVVTLWTIDQARKRKRQNRDDVQGGVKRRAAVPPQELEARRAGRLVREQSEGGTESVNVSRETSQSTAARGDG